MLAAVSNYFQTLVDRFGNGWNRFWYTPSDPTTICALRLATGLVATYTLAVYSVDLLRFIGPSGMLPVSVVNELHQGWRFSYLDYVRGASELWAVHAAGLAILVLYTIGFWTRITSVLALVVILSYVHRAPMITSEFERILALVMFYICLAPAGACLSVDRWLADRKRAQTPSTPEADIPLRSSAATAAVRLLQVHVALVYVMMATAKLSGAAAWWDGTAAWWVTRNLQSSLVDLSWLYNYPKWVNFITHSILAYQLAFPILIWNRLARPLLLALGVVIWTVIAILSGLVSFSLMMLIANFAFMELNCPKGRSGNKS